MAEAALSAGDSASRPLEGVSICLVFEHSLSHYTRVLQQIDALVEAGACLLLLTQFPTVESLPHELAVTRAPLLRFAALPDATPEPAGRGLLRDLAGRVRTRIRRAQRENAERKIVKARHDAVARIAQEVDAFWVVDYPSLPAVMEGAREAGAKVVYETVDLVPEYEYDGPETRLAHLADEERLLGEVDGFITACDSYADYYVERYADSTLRARPVVRDNMPTVIVDAAKPVGTPRSILFMGSLMFDRPVVELIDAMEYVDEDVTLTFQGKNYLGDVPRQRIEELGMEDRILIVDPCPPTDIVRVAREFDIGIVALRGDNTNERYASTSKLFTYMSSGLAILGSDLPGIARVVREYHNGLLVDGMGAKQWGAAINTIAGLPNATLDAMKQASVDAARRHAWTQQKHMFVGEFVRALGAPTESQGIRPNDESVTRAGSVARTGV